MKVTYLPLHLHLSSPSTLSTFTGFKVIITLFISCPLLIWLFILTPLANYSLLSVNADIDIESQLNLDFQAVDKSLHQIYEKSLEAYHLHEASSADGMNVDDNTELESGYKEKMMENIVSILRQYRSLKLKYESKMGDANRQVNLANLLYLSIEHVVRYRTFLYGKNHFNESMTAISSEGGMLNTPDFEYSYQEEEDIDRDFDIFELYSDIIQACFMLYQKAASQVDHYGARYSLGLIKKIYPHVSDSSSTSKIKMGTNERSGYDEMCHSYQAYIRRLEFMHQHQQNNLYHLYQSNKLPGGKEEYMYQTALLCDRVKAHYDWDDLIDEKMASRGTTGRSIKAERFNITNPVLSLVNQLFSLPKTKMNFALDEHESTTPQQNSFIPVQEHLLSKLSENWVTYYVSVVGKSLFHNQKQQIQQQKDQGPVESFKGKHRDDYSHDQQNESQQKQYKETKESKDNFNLKLDSSFNHSKSKSNSSSFLYSLVSIEGRDGVISDMNNFKFPIHGDTIEGLLKVERTLLQNNQEKGNDIASLVFPYHPLSLYKPPSTDTSLAISNKFTSFHTHSLSSDTDNKDNNDNHNDNESSWYKECSIYPQVAGCYVPLYREIPSSPKSVYSYDYERSPIQKESETETVAFKSTFISERSPGSRASPGRPDPGGRGEPSTNLELQPQYYLAVNSVIINLVSFSSIGFYHWMTEGLSRFVLSLLYLQETVEEHGDCESDIYFILPAIMERDKETEIEIEVEKKAGKQKTKLQKLEENDPNPNPPRANANSAHKNDDFTRESINRSFNFEDSKYKYTHLCFNYNHRRKVPHYIETSIATIKFIWIKLLNRRFPYKFVCKADIDRIDILVERQKQQEKNNDNIHIEEERHISRGGGKSIFSSLFGSSQAIYDESRRMELISNSNGEKDIYSSTLLFADWKSKSNSSVDGGQGGGGGSSQLHPPSSLLSILNIFLHLHQLYQSEYQSELERSNMKMNEEKKNDTKTMTERVTVMVSETDTESEKERVNNNERKGKGKGNSMMDSASCRAFSPSAKARGRNIMVYIARPTETSRSLRVQDEHDLLNSLQAICSSYNYDLFVYIGANTNSNLANTNHKTIETTSNLAVFQQASVVLGVHGGGLTNFLFTSPFPYGSATTFFTSHTSHTFPLSLFPDSPDDANDKRENENEAEKPKNKKKTLIEISMYEEEFNEFEHLASSLPFTSYISIKNVIKPGMFDSNALPLTKKQMQSILFSVEDTLKNQ